MFLRRNRARAHLQDLLMDTVRERRGSGGARGAAQRARPPGVPLGSAPLRGQSEQARAEKQPDGRLRESPPREVDRSVRLDPLHV